MERELKTTGFIKRVYIENRLEGPRMEIDVLEPCGMTVEVCLGPPYSLQFYSIVRDKMRAREPITITMVSDGLNILRVDVSPASGGKLEIQNNLTIDDMLDSHVRQVARAMAANLDREIMDDFEGKLNAVREVNKLLDDMGIKYE